MTAYSTDPDSPFVERPRPLHFEPNALDLAKVAAALDPILSKKEPAKAVRLAQNLIAAAQACIEEPYWRHRDEVDYWEQRGKKLRREGLFPAENCVSLSDAFKRWPGKYTTLGGFVNALRRRDLTLRGSKHEELTSKQAVDELGRLRKEEIKAGWRESKKRKKNGMQIKFSRISSGNRKTKSGTSKAKAVTLKTKRES